MCGIAGVVAWDERYEIERQTLERMGETIAHRGPDGRDIWTDERCGLAFARLAILDLDRRAMQPMTDGKRWLVFNGEIYNFRELREELEKIAPGYAWKTTGDSEVILRAFDAWGEKCVEKLSGMFALTIWEPASGSVFLARDRMGQKPLYLALRSGRGLAFASELAALRNVPWIKWDVDLASVSEYLQTGYIAAPATIYRGVAKVPPGCWMRCGADGSVTLQKYFGPNEIDASELISADDVKAAVRRAVETQLISDVPVGCFLSGGIDSSVIAAAMKSAAGKQRILTFSIGFDDPLYDETKFAAQVAGHLGTEHRQFTVRPDAAADLPRLAKVFGEPFGDSSALPTHYLARDSRPCKGRPERRRRRRIVRGLRSIPRDAMGQRRTKSAKIFATNGGRVAGRASEILIGQGPAIPVGDGPFAAAAIRRVCRFIQSGFTGGYFPDGIAGGSRVDRRGLRRSGNRPRRGANRAGHRSHHLSPRRSADQIGPRIDASCT